MASYPLQQKRSQGALCSWTYIKIDSRLWKKTVNRCVNLCFPAIILVLLFAISSGLYADRTPGEYDVKLAFLYNFTKFIDWPEQAFQNENSPFSICVMGKLPPHQTIKHITNRTAKNRPITFQFLHYKYATDNCHVLFLTRSLKQSQIQQVTANLSSGTLLVGEIAGFARKDGVIEFLLDPRNRVRIEINLSRARQYNMEISAQLLEVAAKVYRHEEDNS